MKILKIGDLHIGASKDSAWVQGIQMNAIDQAIDYSRLNGIKRWIQTGDWFDVRQAITHQTMMFNRAICEKIQEAGIIVDVIVGNHDATYKNTLLPNACDELLTQFPNFNVYNTATTVDYDGVAIDLIPWICKGNQAEIYEFIKQSKSLYCVGHFELTGFYFYKGLKSHGVESDFLRKYKRVDSGHFHTHSENYNVVYLGTPYTLTAGDENDERGFWVFDTETHENTFIPNTTIWHRRITYPTSVNPNAYKGLSVRVIVTKIDNNLAKLEAALEAVVHNLQIVNRVETTSLSEDVDSDQASSEIEVKPLTDLMHDYIQDIPTLSEPDAIAIEAMVTELYLEAQKL